MLPILLATSLIAQPIQMDKAAHFSVSYAATHVCQVAVKKVFDTSKLTSTLTCATIVLAAGAAKEVMDARSGRHDMASDMVADTLGTGLAVTIISIDF